MNTAPRIEVDVLSHQPELAAILNQVAGDAGDPLAAIERRARLLLPQYRTILWEGDPQTFQFSYVSPSAATILGYPCERWLAEPDFWTRVVVHPQDRDDAVAFCAIATGQCRDHDFRYRALAADGRVVTLLDRVQVITGSRGIPVKLRGLMLEIPE